MRLLGDPQPRPGSQPLEELYNRITGDEDTTPETGTDDTPITAAPERCDSRQMMANISSVGWRTYAPSIAFSPRGTHQARWRPMM